MKHNDLVEKSLKLLDEALQNVKSEDEVVVGEANGDYSDDDIDDIMNKAAEKKFGKDSPQAKLHQKFGKRKVSKKEKEAADAQAKKDSQS